MIASIPYEEFHERGPHLKQVACVYLFVLALALTIYGGVTLTIYTKNDNTPILLLIAIPLLFAVPWWLRRQARKRAGVLRLHEPRWWKE